MDWYVGGTLLYQLENIHIASDQNHIDCRFPIQNVIRPHREGYEDFRGYAGRIESGVFKPGDRVKILPSGLSTTIDKIFNGDDHPIQEAFSPMSVSITLKDDIDISRGNMIVREGNTPNVVENIDTLINWFSETPLQKRSKFILKHTTMETKAIVNDIKHEIDINTLHRIEDVSQLEINAIGRVLFRTAEPLFTDNYHKNRKTGSFILIDPTSLKTVGAGIIL